MPGEPIRLPADELEQLVIQSIIGWVTQEKSVIDAVGWQNAQLASDALNARVEKPEAAANPHRCWVSGKEKALIWGEPRLVGGRGGIRTLDTVETVYRISSPAHSTTLPPFLKSKPIF